MSRLTSLRLHNIFLRAGTCAFVYKQNIVENFDDAQLVKQLCHTRNYSYNLKRGILVLTREYKYGETISMAEWPSDAYSNYLEKRIKTTHVDFMDKKVDLSSNLAKLEVFYRELVYENIDSQKGYESQNLISDIGGQLGLWLGLSAITVGELMEFFAAIGKAMTASAVKRKQTGPVKTPVEKF